MVQQSYQENSRKEQDCEHMIRDMDSQGMKREEAAINHSIRYKHYAKRGGEVSSELESII